MVFSGYPVGVGLGKQKEVNHVGGTLILAQYPNMAVSFNGWPPRFSVWGTPFPVCQTNDDRRNRSFTWGSLSGSGSIVKIGAR